jgi:hypothetical protein
MKETVSNLLWGLCIIAISPLLLISIFIVRVIITFLQIDPFKIRIKEGLTTNWNIIQ